MTRTTISGREARPSIVIPLTSYDKMLELGAVVLLLVLWGYTIISYSGLPEVIPVHFDLAGTVDRTGSRSIVWLFPALGSIIYFLLAIIGRSPHTFNYPRKITAENAERQYTIALRMMRTLRVGIVALMLAVEVLIGLTGRGVIAGPSGWVIALPLLLVLLPVGWYLRQAYRAA